ncbi:ABC transporter ATP-binding protein [Gorillibacterium timonense]|uniref:ABC transporter ATP-binding protein n=1 Tax=Gorillibacterium timonense TaxID=1689269 RepID=UPI00071D523A|nr:ATP-binding cassette domain-containing protein [Gorillibacterium timonense]
MIELSNITFHRAERTILQDVSMTLTPGEHWVILGRNGSGKTTLLEMMNGYLFPTSGKVRVLGEWYGETDLREIRKRIGYISQSLFEKMSLRDPVWEVVATGAYAFLRFYQQIPSEVKEKALELLEFVDLSKVKNQPLGTLSQGERKKIMLARTLMVEPSILIMDEPCAGLDLYERERFLANVELLRKRDPKLLMLYVTHHIEEIMPSFTHCALLEEGKLLKVGRKEEVLQAEALSQAFGVPIRLEWFQGRPWVKVGL